jgi:hypothetical protein
MGGRAQPLQLHRAWRPHKHTVQPCQAPSPAPPAPPAQHPAQPTPTAPPAAPSMPAATGASTPPRPAPPAPGPAAHLQHQAARVLVQPPLASAAAVAALPAEPADQPLLPAVAGRAAAVAGGDLCLEGAVDGKVLLHVGGQDHVNDLLAQHLARLVRQLHGGGGGTGASGRGQGGAGGRAGAAVALLGCWRGRRQRAEDRAAGTELGGCSRDALPRTPSCEPSSPSGRTFLQKL